ncbi:MAG: prepilin-type N-terminal cleavage/methylation domain-containing protein [Candidatus Omnitrophica bacterium]|nr:prepilin-type N-terminal cleavage/methylation domain-containing protein [Candidatus Omnitrophota bacterium]
MSRSRRTQGFSLVELMVAMVVLGLLIAGAYDPVISSLRLAAAVNTREEIRQQLAHVLEWVIRDAGVADNMDVAETDHVQFDTPAVNNVEYEYDAAADVLTRDDADSSQRTILRNVTAFDFDYVDCFGTTTTGTVSGSEEEDSIRVIQVTATVAKLTESVSMPAAVFTRNLVGEGDDACPVVY